MVQPEYRIYEMNKRLQSRTEVSTSASGGCVCVRVCVFFKAVRGLVLGLLAEFRGKCPTAYYHVCGNERQDESTSLNAGLPGTATLGAGDSFCWNLETDNLALDWQAGSPEMLLPQNSGDGKLRVSPDRVS